MPRDRRAVIGTAIWNEPTIRGLTAAQQHAYLLAYTQPNLNRCGVVPYALQRWTRLATDLTVKKLRTVFRQLHNTRHVVIDDEFEELFVRTFVVHDDLLAQPMITAALARDFEEIASPVIRNSLLAELRRLYSTLAVEDPKRTGLLLLLGADPAHIGLGKAKDGTDQPAAQDRIRKAIGDGLVVPTIQAVEAGEIPPYPEEIRDHLPEGPAKGLTDPPEKGSANSPAEGSASSRARVAHTPSPSPSPSPSPGLTPNPNKPEPPRPSTACAQPPRRAPLHAHLDLENR